MSEERAYERFEKLQQRRALNYEKALELREKDSEMFDKMRELNEQYEFVSNDFLKQLKIKYEVSI